MNTSQESLASLVPATGQGTVPVAIAEAPEPPAAESSLVKNRRGGRLFRALLVLATMLVLYNVTILFTARHSQRHTLLAKLDQIPPETDCVFLGNSLVEAGCDVTAFNAGWPKAKEPLHPINLALGATSPVEHFLILKRALASPRAIKCVVYGFFDDQLNSSSSGNIADLVGNRALSYYFPAEAAAFYSPGSWVKEWELRVLGHIPMVSERSSLWSKVELLRQALSDIGMPKQQMNRFGRVEDFGALEMKDTEAFNRRCQALLEQGAGFSAPVQAMLRLAQTHGVKLILVEMPVPSHHRNSFYSSPHWARLRNHLQSLAERERALYVTASDWVLDDSRFEDATHLTEEGARLFSAALAKTLASMDLPPATSLTQRADVTALKQPEPDTLVAK